MSAKSVYLLMIRRKTFILDFRLLVVNEDTYCLIHIALYYAMNLKSYPGILIPQINDVCVGILTRRHPR